MSDGRKPAHRILVVDDEATIVFVICRYFRARGFEVDGASDLESALRLLSQFSYGLAIVDLRLGELGNTDGLEIVDFARASCPATKVILLTAFGSPRLEEHARSRGVDTLVRKPVPLPELLRLAREFTDG